MAYHASGVAMMTAIITKRIKSFVSEVNDAGNTCAQHFTDPDLLGAPAHTVGGESQQAQAGDEDGEQGEDIFTISPKRVSDWYC